MTEFAFPPSPTLPIPDSVLGPEYYITLTITQPYTTYTTLILLGNSPATAAIGPYQAAQTSAEDSATGQHMPNSGTSTGAIVGIIVGCTVGTFLLFAVLYLYTLRARQWRRKEKRRMRRRRARRASLAAAAAAAAAEQGHGPGPGPPPPDPPAADL